MGTCREIFVLIQQNVAEKTHPGRITITRGRISGFFSAIARRTAFFLGSCIEPYLPSGRPTSDISLNFPSYIFTGPNLHTAEFPFF